MVFVEHDPKPKPLLATKPPAVKPFRKGDSVVYPTHGVGKIDWVGFEDIAGQRLQLIRITFEENQMTLRVPVAKARQTGLRNIASRSQLDKAIQVLSGRARSSRMVWIRKAKEFTAKINSGDLEQLAEVIRDLWSPDLSAENHSRRNICESALDRVAVEFAAIHQVSKIEAITRLNQVLLGARGRQPAIDVEG
jgi:CarD family transcriptional regulator